MSIRYRLNLSAAAVRSIAACVVLLAYTACNQADAPPAMHHLVFGGDVLLGNNLNTALYDDQARGRIFGDLVPLFRGADVAIVNAEGVIARGGDFFDKGDPVPHCFRAHPLAIHALHGAGIDVVSVGNNHVGDYGRAAFAEMLDRLDAAGIAYTGGGRDETEARRPAYLHVDGTVVAFIGANMTSAGPVRAIGNQPGNLFFPDPQERNAAATEATLVALLREARRHAHLVFLTPHWGSGWSEETSPAIRALAHRLIAAGYDGILGHSSHRIHGAEVIGGRPVLYDAGNLTVYWTDDAGPSNHGLVFDLAFDRRGVTEVRALPVLLTENRTDLARGTLATSILNRYVRLSAGLGTRTTVDGGVATFTCDPGPIHEPEEPHHRTPPSPGTAIREAPTTFSVDAVPPTARPLAATFDNGARLVGARVEPPAIPRRQPSLLVTLYWTASGPIVPGALIRLEAHGREARGRPRRARFDHLPGDWMLPMAQWAPDSIVRDRTILRLGAKWEGEVELRVGVEGARPTDAGGLPVAGDLLSLGTVPIVPQGPGLLDVLRAARLP